MQIKVAGEVYDFDDTKLSVKEARTIKELTGLGISQWGEGIRDGDPDALVAMIYLAKKRSGEAVRWRDLDDLDLMNEVDFINDDEGDQADDSDGDEPAEVPTPAAEVKPAAKKKTAAKTQKTASSSS